LMVGLANACSAASRINKPNMFLFIFPPIA
jgi:hypothetical protein